MNTAPATIAVRKGSHVRLLDGTFMPSRAYPMLAGVWGKQAHKDTNRRAPIPTRPKGNRPANALLTLQDVAARLQVSVKQVRKLVDDGLLRYINIGRGSKYRTMRFQPTDVQECIQQLTKRNAPSCPSTNRRTRRTTNTTSSAEVVGFTARRNARAEGKPKP